MENIERRKFRKPLINQVRKNNRLLDNMLELVNSWNDTTGKSKHECADALLDLVCESTGQDKVSTDLPSRTNKVRPQFVAHKQAVIDGELYYVDSKGGLWPERPKPDNCN